MQFQLKTKGVDRKGNIRKRRETHVWKDGVELDIKYV